MNNYGYKKSKPNYKNHKFGSITALKGIPLCDGHWLKYIPIAENQDKGFPTFACTDFAGTNVFEIILDFKIANNLLEPEKLQFLKDNGYIDSNGKVNFSDRFLAITSDTDPASGNDPHKVAETIRKIGLIPETSLPYDSTITSSAKFYSPKPMTQDLLDKADKFLDIFGTGYDDVYPTAETLKEALKYSPLTIAVKAWFPRGDKFYFPDGISYNHDTILLDYEDGLFWWIFDSYESNLKKVEWNSIFDEPLRYQIGNPTDFKLSFIERILQKYQAVVNLLVLMYNNMMNQDKVSPIDQTIPPMTPPVSKIQIWAKSIQTQEGGKPTDRNMVNNNPGNLKFTTYTQSLGATGKDVGNFCVFPNYQSGFTALCKFLIDACENNLAAYHNVTLDQFTTTYAQPPNKNYVNAVAQALGVKVDIPIKNLL